MADSATASTPAKVVFNHTVEAMFTRALGAQLTPNGKRRLKELGIDLARLAPSYPFDIWMESLRIAASDAFPTRSIDDAMFRMGELLIEGYRSTIMGNAVLGMIRMLGPKRTLSRTTQNFRSGNNYTEARLVETGPTSYELWMNEVGAYPQFTAGIIHAGLRASGAEGVEITTSGHDGHACTYQIRWK